MKTMPAVALTQTQQILSLARIGSVAVVRVFLIVTVVLCIRTHVQLLREEAGKVGGLSVEEQGRVGQHGGVLRKEGSGRAGQETHAVRSRTQSGRRHRLTQKAAESRNEARTTQTPSRAQDTAGVAYNSERRDKKISRQAKICHIRR